MDVCVVLYKSDASRLANALRDHDTIWIVDNTFRNVGFAAGANEAARMGSDPLVLFVNPDGDLTSQCLDALELALDDQKIVAAEPDLGVWNREPHPSGDMEWLSGACMVVRRSAFEEVGGFDERLFMYCEDVDLSYKLSRFGRLAHVAEASFTHDAGGRSFKALHRHARNHLIVQKRHRQASPGRMLRDAVLSLRSRHWRHAIARATGTIDYGLRGRGWV